MHRIAVTGATGAVGGRVARLLGPGVARLIVREPARAPRVDGDPQIVAAEYGDADAMRAALDGIDVLLLVSGAESPSRRQQHRTAIAAAADAGVRHLVYTSFDGAAPDAVFTLGRDHWDAEEAIRASGTAFTLLRDSFYLEVFPMFADEAGTTRGPAGEGRVAAVSRADVADVAAAVLADPDRFAGAVLTLTGPEALSFQDAARRMTAALGRPYRFEDQTVEEAVTSRRVLTNEDWLLDAWVSTYTAIASGALARVSDDVPDVTGHPARTLEEALAEPTSAT